MPETKIQHYVPQFLLRNFGAGKKDQVHVFDKWTGRSFCTNAKNVACEGRFYDFTMDGEVVSFEPFLSQIESATKPIIEGVLKADSLVVLSSEDRETIAAFLSVQLTRTKAFREQWNEFPKLLRERLERDGNTVEPGTQVAQLIADISDNESKTQTVSFMMKAPQLFSRAFLSKPWLLVATTPIRPFMLGDNPFVRQNSLHPGESGLESEGIEIYFPLSSTRSLAIWCPTLVNIVRDAARRQRQSGDDAGKRGKVDLEGILALDYAITHGCPAMFGGDNVINFNSLQVAGSERYVCSSNDDFSLVKTMLKDRRPPVVE